MSGSESDERYTYAPGALLPGTPYKVLRALGAGGMGVVYAVEHTFLKRKEALKTIHPELIDRRDIAERMAREASVVGNLKHPNIVQVTGGGIIDDQWKLPYFAMEMLRGKNLRQVLGKRTLTDFASVYNIAYEVLSALAEAHAHKVVHRDVKPENIFLHFDSTRSAGPQVTAKLLDFGVMAVLGGRQSMSFRGTYKYAAPEQLRGEKVGPQTDIYAMALVVYEMIAGRGPFDDIRDARDLVKAHVEKEAPRISQFARVHASVDDLLARALAKDPAKRPPTAMGFALDLRPLKRAPDAPAVFAANTEESLLTTVTGAVTDGGRPPPDSAGNIATAKDQALPFARTKPAAGERRDDDVTQEEPIPAWALRGGTLEDANAPVMPSDQPSSPVAVQIGLQRTDVDRRAVTRTADPIPRGVPTHGTEPIPDAKAEAAPDSTRRYVELEDFLLDETSDATAGARSTPSRRDGTPPPVSPIMTGAPATGAPTHEPRRRQMGFAVAAAVVAVAGATFWMTTRAPSRPVPPSSPPAAAVAVQAPTTIAAPLPTIPIPIPQVAPAPTASVATVLPSATPAVAAAAPAPGRPYRGPARNVSPSVSTAKSPSPAGAAPPPPVADPEPPVAVVATPPAPTAAPKSSGDSELKRSVVH